MAAPVWIRAKDISLSINGVSRPADDAQLSEDVGEVDVTNLLSPVDVTNGNCLQAEFTNDVIVRRLKGSHFVDSGAVANFAIGSVFADSFSVAGEQATSGNIRITKRSKTGSPKGAFKVQWEGVFTGAVTTA